MSVLNINVSYDRYIYIYLILSIILLFSFKQVLMCYSLCIVLSRYSLVHIIIIYYLVNSRYLIFITCVALFCIIYVLGRFRIYINAFFFISLIKKSRIDGTMCKENLNAK